MDLTKKSVKVLQKLQLKNGAILASLKNDAYPYVYPRDGTIICSALNSRGKFSNSIKFYRFMENTRPNHCLEQRCLPNGLPYVTQRGERDIYGLVLSGIWDTFKRSQNIEFLEDMWELVNKAVNGIQRSIKNNLLYTRRSIHEYIAVEMGFEIWANSACCRGLYDASKIAEALKKYQESKNWLRSARKLNLNIKNKLFSKRKKLYIKTLTLNGKIFNKPDISMLAPFYFGIDDSQTILKNTMKMISKNLWHKKLGGILRFKSFETVNSWHWYTGGDGPFSYLTMMAARFFNLINDTKNFEKCWDWIQNIPTKEGYFPERMSFKKDYELWKKNEWEFSDRIIHGINRAEKLKTPRKNVVYWATPLGWSHAEYLLLISSL